MNKNSRAITLTELLVAISLIGLVIIGIGSLEVFARRHLLAADRRARLQNEDSLALEHITKHLNQAIGNITDTPIQAQTISSIQVRIDSNQNGQVDLTDTSVYYRRSGTNVQFSTNGANWQNLATHIVAPGAAGFPNGGFIITTPQINQFDITITSRWDPGVAATVNADNPQIQMQTSVVAPSVSVN